MARGVGRGEPDVRRSIPLVVAVLGLLPTAAATALAHPGEEHAEKTMTTGALAQPEKGTPLPDLPRYAFREDGTVVIDGDVLTDCSSFASSLDRGGGFRGDAGQARSVLEQCEEAGLLSLGGTTSSASAGASASATASPLPTTGGSVPLMALAPLALLVGSGLLVFRIVSRS